MPPGDAVQILENILTAHWLMFKCNLMKEKLPSGQNYFDAPYLG